MTRVLAPDARHYRLPTATTWFFRAFVALCTLIVAVALIDNEGGTFGLVGGLLCVLVIAAIWLWGERRLPKAGIYETAEGLRAIRVPGSSFARWQRIGAFEASSKLPRSRVMVVGTNGRRVPLIGTAQGARIVWDTGETRDIVAVLNERLAIWKAVDGEDAPSAN